MNKEVKLGLAIGGVLLSVLIVYVLVVSGDPAPTDQVTLALPEGGPAAETAVAATPQSDPFAQSSIPPAPAAAHDLAPVTPEPPAGESTPTPAPSEALDTPTVSVEDKWLVLHNGMIETTTTPQVQSPALPENPPAAVAPVAQMREPSNPAVIPSQNENRGPSIETEHVIRRGETFSSIAAAVYGSSAYYAHLVRANPSVNPNRLRPGMVIKIPPRSQVVAVNTASDTTRTLDERSEYRVQGGDSLYKISMKLYGKPDRMDRLYELNKAIIGSDRTKLHVGQVLKLPEQPTVRTQ